MLFTRLDLNVPGAAVGVLLAMAASCDTARAAAPPPLQAEVSDILSLPAPGPHRFFTMMWGRSIVIFDGDSGKIEGQVPAAPDSNLRTTADNR